MKTKTLITFDVQKQEVWGKGLRKRNNSSFILIAQTPDTGTLYAATIESGLSKRYKTNRQEIVERMVLLKDKASKKRFLQVQLTNGETLSLKNENYFLLIHAPDCEKGDQDYILAFNMPEMLEEGAHYQIFTDDAENGNAIALFWLLKDFIPQESEETMA
ncbi:MAG: hypothetical protein HFH51_10880 [Lachnospiraceae bacterium]|nr:hypothetical protein [Lachnospiraceae bacterium]